MVRRSSLLALAAALCALACGACAARVLPDDTFEIASGQQGLRASAQSALFRMLERGKERKEDEMEETRAYTTIKFIVPPHKSDKFEEVWLDLDEDVQDEKDNDIHTLKSQALDNYVYVSYGEWNTLHGLHKHLTSRHFEKFSDWVDDNEVVWFLEVLKNESEDIEEDEEEAQRQRKRKVSELSDAALAMAPSHDKHSLSQLYGGLTRRKDLAHIIIKYYVPTGMGEDFVDEWTDAAESTIKEKGNRIYSLRKLASDNVRWYAYGSWESMRDFVDHWESKHVERFKEFLDKNDIIWSVEFLEAIGGEKGK